MKEKIISFIKRAYRPIVRSLILLGLFGSFLIAVGVTVNQKKTADNQIFDRQQFIDNINQKTNQEYQDKLNSVECKNAEAKYSEDQKNKVRGTSGLLSDSYYERIIHCPANPFLTRYETDLQFNRFQSIKNRSFLSLFANNLFIGKYSDFAAPIFYLTMLLVFLAPISLLLVALYKKIRSQSKLGFEEYQKMPSFQKYSLALFAAILIILIFIFLKLR